jgi:hypothetical protein
MSTTSKILGGLVCGLVIACSSAPVTTTPPDAASADAASPDVVAPDAGGDANTGPDASAPPVPLACTKSIGTGSGAITISQSAQGLVDGDVLCIKAGTYSSISLMNVAASSGQTITVQNDGVVEITGSTYGTNFSNLTNVVVSGGGVGWSTTASGIAFHDLTYRALILADPLHGVTFQYIDFTNIGDYVFDFMPTQTYDGTPSTLMTDLHILHVNATNLTTTLLTFNATGPLTGLTQNLEVGWCTINGGISLGDFNGVFGVDIHHNVVKTLNLASDVHNGVIFLQGDGAIHHNYISDVLGSGIRAWPSSLQTKGRLDIYDNIFLDSIKYSAMEIQPNAPYGGFSSTQSSYFTNTDYFVYSNTAGDLNLCAAPTNPATLPPGPACWFGALVDTYDSDGGVLTIANNLVFDINGTNGGDAIQNIEGNLGAMAILENNLTFSTYQAAGLIDNVSCKPTAQSPVVGAGVVIPGFVDDYFGNPRTSPPDVGAVQH